MTFTGGRIVEILVPICTLNIMKFVLEYCEINTIWLVFTTARTVHESFSSTKKCRQQKWLREFLLGYALNPFRISFLFSGSQAATSSSF